MLTYGNAAGALTTEQRLQPAIRGRAWITGVAELYVDDRDPFRHGIR